MYNMAPFRVLTIIVIVLIPTMQSTKEIHLNDQLHGDAQQKSEAFKKHLISRLNGKEPDELPVENPLNSDSEINPDPQNDLPAVEVSMPALTDNENGASASTIIASTNGILLIRTKRSVLSLRKNPNNIELCALGFKRTRNGKCRKIC